MWSRRRPSRSGRHTGPLAASDPPVTDSGPLATFPYRRNAHFTGRGDLLARLHDGFARNPVAGLTQARAISGLGGIGKTQTAIEYCYRYAGDYQTILWALADTEVSLDSAYAEIARRLGLAGQTPAEIRDAVKRWLAGTEGYLLVLDNADDPPLLDRYLPAAPRGHILITSRAHDFTRLGMAHPEDVPVLPPAEAVAFLLHRAGRPAPDAAERDAAESLTGDLGYLPLALEQAAAYLAAKGSTFRDYLAAYRRRRLGILEAASPEVGPPHPGVAKTWSINFQQVEQESKAAADLIRLSAFLAPEAIPHEILVEGAPHLGKPLSAALAGAKDDPLVLDELLAIPARYSLIQRDPGAGAYEMHRMLQEVVRAGMPDTDRRCWAERAVEVIDAAFPWVRTENWNICERLLPHALICAEYIESHSIVTHQSGRLLTQAGYYLKVRESYSAALPICRRAVEIRLKVLGPHHLDTAHSIDSLGGLYHRQGMYGEAEPLFRLALAIREEVLPPDHPDIARGLTYLARLYLSQGRHQEAESTFQRALAIGERLPELRETGVIMSNLAWFRNSQGMYAAAQHLHRRALEIREKALGPAHPDTAESLNNLAALLDSQGKHAEAEPLYRRALLIFEKALGSGHPYTAMCLSNLARTLHDQGKYTEAEPLYRRALQIREEVLGPAHPDTATSLNDLAALLDNQGRYAEAEPLCRRALAIWETALGPAHPHTALACENLAGLLREMDRNDEAAELEARSGEIRDAYGVSLPGPERKTGHKR